MQLRGPERLPSGPTVTSRTRSRSPVSRHSLNKRPKGQGSVLGDEGCEGNQSSIVQKMNTQETREQNKHEKCQTPAHCRQRDAAGARGRDRRWLRLLRTVSGGSLNMSLGQKDREHVDTEGWLLQLRPGLLVFGLTDAYCWLRAPDPRGLQTPADEGVDSSPHTRRGCWLIDRTRSWKTLGLISCYSSSPGPGRELSLRPGQDLSPLPPLGCCWALQGWGHCVRVCAECREDRPVSLAQ